ncbi:putative kinase CHARK [Panicum miliaceum]|uniref:Kinase CHARK n=1 Tax=Panicum miliaceum TaxID=4540 RepID=A0A3L6TEN2_PANMI|nr:putative kinase CHARK [Panicum miliaceum]
MAASSFGARLLSLFLFSACCQHHGLLASRTPAPSSNGTLGRPLPASHAHHDGVVNSTSTTAKEDVAPAVGFFDRSPPPSWSKAKLSWPDTGSSPSTLPKHKSGSVGDLFVMGLPSNKSRVGNPTSRADREGRASVDSNGNATEPTSRRQQEPPLAYSYGWPRRNSKSGRASPRARKPLCSYRRTASLLHDRIECSGAVIVVVAGSALLVLVCSVAVAGLLVRCVHRKRRGENEISGAAADPEDDDDRDLDRPARRPGLLQPPAGARRYSYGTLAAATSNFAERKRIGRGGFGSVYRGHLGEQDRHVAVKTFSAAGSPEQGRREFEAEVLVMSQLRHRNVVQLVGWSDGQKGLLLVYELVPGGSLHKQLHDPDRLLTWPERYKIALDLGAAVLYLHTGSDQCVVHGDIKPSNVLLDLSGNAKLGDFGLARLVDHGAEPLTTQVVAGTLGYIDPEFIDDQRRGTESDVYSFGVVLLEIADGRMPTALGQQRKEASSSMLLNRVRRMYDRNAVLDAPDGRMGGAFDERQMERVLVTGLWCADRDRSRRPSISEAMDVLRGANSELPALTAVAPHGCGEIRVLEEQAHGDPSTEDGDDGSTISSASTAYLSLDRGLEISTRT